MPKSLIETIVQERQNSPGWSCSGKNAHLASYNKRSEKWKPEFVVAFVDFPLAVGIPGLWLAGGPACQVSPDRSTLSDCSCVSVRVCRRREPFILWGFPLALRTRCAWSIAIGRQSIVRSWVLLHCCQLMPVLSTCNPPHVRLGSPAWRLTLQRWTQSIVFLYHCTAPRDTIAPHEAGAQWPPPSAGTAITALSRPLWLTSFLYYLLLILFYFPLILCYTINSTN